MKEQHTFLISVKYLWYALVVKKQFRITRTGGAHALSKQPPEVFYEKRCS